MNISIKILGTCSGGNHIAFEVTTPTGVFTGAVIDWEGGNTGYVDWAAVRQYLASPPTLGTILDV